MLTVYPPSQPRLQGPQRPEERPITSTAVAYNHFLPSLPRPPFAFALFAHTIIYLFIPFFSVCLPLWFFCWGKKDPNGAEGEVRDTQSEIHKQQIRALSSASSISDGKISSSNNLYWHEGLLTTSVRLVVESNLPTDCLCKCRSSCLAHATERRKETWQKKPRVARVRVTEV